VRLSDVAPLRDAGAAGIAVVSAICGAADPAAASRAFRAAADAIPLAAEEVTR
jgi:thiamine monophosphate synthase